MNEPTPKDMQLQIDALKAEVKSLKEFVRALYNMIVEDEEIGRASCRERV